ncbi:hypothetical protein COZ40_03590, partial [Candidatus Roizmanbacteria bacterium CG_4_10_14_3_um_filter_39_13]
YFLKTLSEEEKQMKVRELASAFQEAVFDTILFKAEKAIQQTGISRMAIGGGVSANNYLRKRFRALVNKHKGTVYFPTISTLNGDNAAMIGIAAWKKAELKLFTKGELDRQPRMKIISSCN